MNDLVEREGIHYKKFSDTPFTGKVTGQTQGSFKNGKKDGPWVRYWPNGQLSYKTIYEDGKVDGPWVGYFESGRLVIKGTYKDGKKDGPWVQFLPDGNVFDEGAGTFKNGVKVK